MKSSWTELDFEVLSQNISNVNESLPDKTELIFVVKANAYGHGLLPVSEHAWKCGIKSFAVAHIEEAVALRELLPDARILITGSISSDDVGVSVKNRLIVMIVSEKHAHALASELSVINQGPLMCHVKIDTGMGRLGIPWEDALEAICRIKSINQLEVCGICSHFSSAGGVDPDFTDLQAKRFMDVIQLLKKRGVDIPFKHMANSAAVSQSLSCDLDAVRLGILLYGYGDIDEDAANSSLLKKIYTKPFLQWKTRVLQVKKVDAGFSVGYGRTYITKHPTNLATIDVGYCDGYSRLLSNKGYVLIGGERKPIVGTVTMNLVTVDLGSDSPAKEGDEVVLVGEQNNESIWANDLARWRDTITYEVLTNIGK